MNKADAKKIADTVTREQLAAMFDKAKVSITDWAKPTTMNPGISYGAAWNMMYPLFVKGIRLGPLVTTNILWVFGDYLDDALKPAKKDQRKSPAINVFHQEPIFEVTP